MGEGKNSYSPADKEEKEHMVPPSSSAPTSPGKAHRGQHHRQRHLHLAHRRPQGHWVVRHGHRPLGRLRHLLDDRSVLLLWAGVHDHEVSETFFWEFNLYFLANGRTGSRGLFTRTGNYSKPQRKCISPTWSSHRCIYCSRKTLIRRFCHGVLLRFWKKEERKVLRTCCFVLFTSDFFFQMTVVYVPNCNIESKLSDLKYITVHTSKILY